MRERASPSSRWWWRPALITHHRLWSAPPRTRITNVFVFDGRSPDLQPPRDVILQDGRIEAIVAKRFAPWLKARRSSTAAGGIDAGLLVDGDPLIQPQVIDRIHVIIKDGAGLERHALATASAREN